MSDVYVGNNIVGNFKPDENIVGEIQEYSLDKYDGCLHLSKGKKVIKLEALDDNSRLVVTNFSEEIGDLNESIYKLEYLNGIVVVILYTYADVKKLIFDSESICIHLRRDVEKQFIGEGYQNMPNLPLNNLKDIVPYLTNMFVNNRSIFVYIDPKNKNTFQLYGNKYRANVIMERPGVYIIDKIYKTYNKEFSFSLTQLYGNVKFVLWSEATEIAGNPSIKLDSVKTNDVFRAWDQYMDFEKKLYEDNLRETGIIKYNSIKVNGDEIVFELEESIENKDVSQLEFEFISEFDPFSEEEVRILPKDTEELIIFKQLKYANIVYLGKAHNEGIFENKLIFPIPLKNFMDGMKKHKGYLYVSDHGLKVEQNRRKRVLAQIESKRNESANIIMKLSASDVVDAEIGTDIGPINHKVLKKMFGNPNVTLKETYMEAMSIALNTPDIALIQGPPGTGKTTLIKGVITRLNLMNKNYRILVSSEQHEALFNVVGKLSQNNFIPPFVSSKRFAQEDDDNERFENNIKEFQQNFISVCNDILRDNKTKNRSSIILTEIIYIIQCIRDNNYSKNYISTIIDELKNKVVLLGYYSELENEFSSLYHLLKVPTYVNDVEELDFVLRMIVRKIESQRIDLDTFVEDDGVRQLRDLQNLLKTNDYDEFLLDVKLFEVLQTGDREKVVDIFDEYISYVENLKNEFLPHEENIFEDKKITPKDIIENISKKISILSKNKTKDFYDIVEILSFRLSDIDSSAEIIKNYTTVVGSTCAQAERSVDLVELQQNKYDYVIIDEAARANPLDIMIPMMLGTKVILIGDHKQLPHYIEANYVNKFKNEKTKYEGFDEGLLTKSLFQIIYENLELAYKENRIKYKRTIRINEQHRMHPTIGTFISDTFYDGGIENGPKTINNINDYNLFDKKNVVWIDVPVFRGLEESAGQSLQRTAEVSKIIKLLEDLVKKNPNRKLDVGIISFYKGQVELIRNKLKESFPENVFTNKFEEMCNTVDSYQGKEFDIVIISGVRSNSYSTALKSLGFIHNSPSRINVALSRAKKLLIMVGDSDTYRKNEYFQKFIYYVKKEGFYEQ